MTHGSIAPAGDLTFQVTRGRPLPYPAVPLDPTHLEIACWGLPRKGLAPAVNDWRARNFPNLYRGWWRLAVARSAQKLHQMPFLYGTLYLTVFRGNGDLEDLGLASLRVVTTAGVTYIAADIAGGASDSNLFKFHGFGTGTTAEASADTTLVTELTTQYNPDSTRPTGNQTASTNTYTTVGTVTPDSGGTIAVTEHGIFTATSAGTLLDRSKFAAVNLDSTAGDSLQATYVLTLPAGS